MAEPLGNTINLKWNHRGIYHRFEIPREAGCSTLMERITTIFPNFYGQIGWKDEDGDTVIISSDEELMHAASLPQNQQLLRLFTIDKVDESLLAKSKGNGCTPNSSRKKQEVSKLDKGSPAGPRRERLSNEVHSSSRRLLLMAHEQILNTQKLFRKSVRASSSEANETDEAASKMGPDDSVKSNDGSQKQGAEKGQGKEKKNTGGQPHLKSMFSTAKRKITGDKSKKIVKAESIKLDGKATNGEANAMTAASKKDQGSANPEAGLVNKMKTFTVADSSKNSGNPRRVAGLGELPEEAGTETSQKTLTTKSNTDSKKSGDSYDADGTASISSDSDIEIIEKCDHTQAHDTGVDDWTFINPTGSLQDNSAV